MLLKETDASAAAEKTLQGLVLSDKMDAASLYFGIDTHCQKEFSEWFLFVTLYQIFSSILEMGSLMLRFKSLSSENVCNGIRAAHEYSYGCQRCLLFAALPSKGTGDNSRITLGACSIMDSLSCMI